jgi:hypothetical protein
MAPPDGRKRVLDQRRRPSRRCVRGYGSPDRCRDRKCGITDDAAARKERRLRRPSNAAPFEDRFAGWLDGDPGLPTRELLRRSKDTVTRARRRPAPPLLNRLISTRSLLVCGPSVQRRLPRPRRGWRSHLARSSQCRVRRLSLRSRSGRYRFERLPFRPFEHRPPWRRSRRARSQRHPAVLHQPRRPLMAEEPRPGGAMPGSRVRRSAIPRSSNSRRVGRQAGR